MRNPSEPAPIGPFVGQAALAAARNGRWYARRGLEKAEAHAAAAARHLEACRRHAARALAALRVLEPPCAPGEVEAAALGATTALPRAAAAPVSPDSSARSPMPGVALAAARGAIVGQDCGW
jgi:hypothetical protein